ncbi:Bicaudal D-related protein-like protein [Frankliniella fusca]|uniref:Bicaudal D-related protein-like protein n=1 Tax=Frankliniella fusca TaxID=407009 RepID=A0AAE1GZK3_9NEOP|nr:Bicaudal D-related protein-like protein [Frankliniella fusca]
MSSVRGSLRRSRRPGPGSSPLGAGTLGAGASPRPSLSSLSSLGSDHPDGVHGVLDSLMGEGAKMQPKYALEDYIYEVQARAQGDMADHHHLHHLRPGAGPGQGEPGDQQQGEDVYAELQRKEKDLILAAELGKALLEKNEELSRQNERIAEEFSQKLEVIAYNDHEPMPMQICTPGVR